VGNESAHISMDGEGGQREDILLPVRVFTKICMASVQMTMG